MAGFWKAFFGAGSRRAKNQKTSSGTETYSALRNQILALAPKISPSVGNILGVLMETGYKEAVATLVVLADGTVSLYFSNGGGMIGLGGVVGPRDAGRRLLENSPQFLHILAPTSSPSPPSFGRTQFIVITAQGLFAAVAPEQDLGEQRHALSPLFYVAQDVITQIRLNSQKESS